MNRFLLMAVSLAQFCMVLWPIRQLWRRCLEWFTESLSVFRCNETGKIVWFAPSFKDVPRNSVNTFLSLCSMTLLHFSLFMCLFFLQFSGRASLWGVWPVLQGTCIHGLTEFKADLKYLSVVWEVSGLLHWGAAPCWLRSRQNTFLLFCSLPHHCGVQKNPSPALFLATVMLEVSDVYFVSPFCCILLCFPSVLAATCWRI